MATSYEIKVLVLIDRNIEYIPDTADLKFKVGDSLNFFSPQGSVTVVFDKPHIFSGDTCGEGVGPVQIIKPGSFVAHPTVTLTNVGPSLQGTKVGWPEDTKVGASGSSGDG